MYVLYIRKQKKKCFSHVKSLVTLSYGHSILYLALFANKILIFFECTDGEAYSAGTCLYGSLVHVTNTRCERYRIYQERC